MTTDNLVAEKLKRLSHLVRLGPPIHAQTAVGQPRTGVGQTAEWFVNQLNSEEQDRLGVLLAKMLAKMLPEEAAGA